MADFKAPAGMNQFQGPSGTNYLVPPSGIVTIKSFDTLAAFNAGFYPVVTGMATIIPQLDGGRANSPVDSMFYIGDGGDSEAQGSPLVDAGGA